MYGIGGLVVVFVWFCSFWLVQGSESCSSHQPPQFQITPLLSHEIQLENVMERIAQFYNDDSDIHLAYFIRNSSIGRNELARLTCSASYPIEIMINNSMAVRVDDLSYSRTVNDYANTCSYHYEITFILTLQYSVTGTYICQEIERSGKKFAKSMLHLFVNEGPNPTLLNAHFKLLDVDGIPDDEGLFRIPCISTDPCLEPQLFKVNLLMQQLQNTTKALDYVKYVPGQGFFISSDNIVSRAYSCTLLDNVSLKIRLRELTSNTGSGIPTHFRIGSISKGMPINNPNSSISINLSCESNKPIQFTWTLQDPKLKFDARYAQVETTYYKYKSTLGMMGQIRRTFKVTCQSNATGQILHFWDYKVIRENSNNAAVANVNGTSAVAVAIIQPGIKYILDDGGQPHFQCISSERKTPFIALITCGNQINCKMAQRFSYLATRPEFYPFNVSRGYACYNSKATTGCAIIPLAVGNRDGLVMCQEEPTDPNVETKPFTRYQNYYTGLGESILTELNTSNASEQTLRFHEPSLDGIVYVDENVTFVCEASKFIFAKGIQFFVHFTNGSVMSAAQYEPNLLLRESSENGIITSQIRISIRSVELTKIECSAPLWSTHTWRNVTHTLTIAEGIRINFNTNSDTKREVTFILAEVNQSLSCEAWGEPRPILQWMKDGQNISTVANTTVISSKQENEYLRNEEERGSRSVVRFHVVKEFHSGTYFCNAVNRKSVGSHQFMVKVQIQTPEESNSKVWMIIVGFIIAGIILIGAIGIIAYCKLKKRFVRVQEKLSEIEINEFMNGNQAMKRKYTDLHENARYLPYKQDFEIPNNKLEILNDEMLGSGVSGFVHKGFLTRHETRIPVAIKTVRSTDIGTLKILLSEIKILMYIGNHENVIHLLGARTNELRDGKLLAVIEFCKYGCLQEFIRANRPNFVDQIIDDEIRGELKQCSKGSVWIHRSKGGDSWKLDDFLMNPATATTVAATNRESERLSLSLTPSTSTTGQPRTSCTITTSHLITTTNLALWSMQIAAGMEYLGQKKVIHGDLALRNILLADNMVIKITDFGLSRHLYDYEIYYKKRKDDLLPWKWLAIEAIGDSRFSIETDIWAYAVTLWEIYSLAETPYQGFSWGEEFVQKLTKGYRLPQAKYSTQTIHEMMLKCWAKKPAQRPSFTVLKQYFQGLSIIAGQSSHVNEAN